MGWGKVVRRRIQELRLVYESYEKFLLYDSSFPDFFKASPSSLIELGKGFGIALRFVS